MSRENRWAMTFMLGVFAGTFATIVAITFATPRTANADDGHLDGLREIASAIRDKDCK